MFWHLNPPDTILPILEAVCGVRCIGPVTSLFVLNSRTLKTAKKRAWSPDSVESMSVRIRETVSCTLTIEFNDAGHERNSGYLRQLSRRRGRGHNVLGEKSTSPHRWEALKIKQYGRSAEQ
jgi:hypothetical protein